MKLLLYEKKEKAYIENNSIILQKVSFASFIVHPFNYHNVSIDICE